MIKTIGVERQLQQSIDANTSEFDATLTMMFEKVRNDLQPIFLRVIDELNHIADERHLAFLGSVDSAFRELVDNNQGLQGELKAWEKLKEHRDRLDREHEERRKRLLKETEESIKGIQQRIIEHRFEADPQQKELSRTIKDVVQENGMLKQCLLDVSRLAQDLGLFSYKRIRGQILDNVRRILNV